MRPYKLVSFLSSVTAMFLLSACSSDNTTTPERSVETAQELSAPSYYMRPSRSYDKQANLGKSDVSLLGELSFSAPNALYTGIDTIPLAFYYNDEAQDESSFGAWRHSFSKRLDSHVLPLATLTSQTYGSKEELCENGFNDMQNYMDRLGIANYSVVFNTEADTCQVFDEDERLVVELPIYSENNETMAYHMLTREDGEKLLFTPSEEGVFRAVNDARLLLVQEGDDWVFSNENDVQETYNSEGQLREVMMQGQRINLAYAEDGKLVRIADAFGNEVTFVYDEAGRITKIENSEDAITNLFTFYGNNIASHVLQNQEENLTLFNAVYDAQERIETLNYPSDVNLSYRYNAFNEVIAKTMVDLKNKLQVHNRYKYSQEHFYIFDDANNTLNIDYEMLNSSIKVRHIQDNNASLSLDYDRSGLLETLQTEEFRTELSYNLQGLITAIRGENNQSVAFSYDDLHNMPTQIIRDGQVQTVVYNLLGQIVESSRETFQDYFAQRSAGRKSKMKYYSYDEKGRLVQVDYPNAQSHMYTYENSVKKASTLVDISEALPSLFDATYHTVLSSWNLEFNEALPHSERYYKGSNTTYYDWVAVDDDEFHTTLYDGSYIFIGYSYGGDSVLELSTRDFSATPNLEVDLIVTIDPVGWLPTLEPTSKNWINVTARTTMKELKNGRFEYSGKKWGIPIYKWVVSTKYVPEYDPSDLLAVSGGKKTYLPLAGTLQGGTHEQIDFLGHHTEFNCMLAEVSNRHPEIGLFKENSEDSRKGKFIDGCHMGSSKTYLIESLN